MKQEVVILKRLIIRNGDNPPLINRKQKETVIFLSNFRQLNQILHKKMSHIPKERKCF